VRPMSFSRSISPKTLRVKHDIMLYVVSHFIWQIECFSQSENT